MAKPKIINQADVQAYAEMELRDLLNNFNEIYVKKTEDLRDDIEKETQVNLQGYQEYFNTLTEGTYLQRRVQLFLNQVNGIAVQGNNNQVQAQITNVMDAWRRWTKSIKKGGVEQSHQDFSVQSGHLFIIYTGLQKLGEEVFVSQGLRGVNLRKGGEKDPEGQKYFTLSQFNDLVERIRRLWITAKAVADMPIGMFKGDPIKDITLALEEYFKNTDQAQHLANKVKQVDVLTGKVAQNIKIEVQTPRSKTEAIIARSRGAARLDFDNKDFKTATENVIWTRLTGSNPLEGEVVKQLTDIAAGKKPKKYKSKTVSKKRNTKKIRISSKEKLRASMKRAAATGLKPIKLRPVKRQSESGATNQREINKLKAKINARLPAEVRRNMGRPALINRTSRFSNSAMLTELRQGPKTLIGKYTYMLNPYETFENEGQKQWPTGYNPKPLIAQSIRNLAMQYTEQKFTLRRD